MSKDFIKNNIKYVTKLSSKINRDKSNKGSLSSRNKTSKQKGMVRNSSNGNFELFLSLLGYLNTSKRNLVEKIGKSIGSIKVQLWYDYIYRWIRQK